MLEEGKFNFGLGYEKGIPPCKISSALRHPVFFSRNETTEESP